MVGVCRLGARGHVTDLMAGSSEAAAASKKSRTLANAASTMR